MKDSQLLRQLFGIQDTETGPLRLPFKTTEELIKNMPEPKERDLGEHRGKKRVLDDQLELQIATHSLLTGDTTDIISEKFKVTKAAVDRAIANRLDGPNAIQTAGQAAILQNVLFSKILLMLGSIDNESIATALAGGKLKDVAGSISSLQDMREKIAETQTGRGWDKGHTPESSKALLDDIGKTLAPVLKVVHRIAAIEKINLANPTEGVEIEQD